MESVRRSNRQRKLQQQQQTSEKQIYVELEELRERLGLADDQRMLLENIIDDLHVANLKLQKDVLELKVQLQELHNVPNQLEQAFGWVASGFSIARQTLERPQQQQQQIQNPEQKNC